MRSNPAAARAEMRHHRLRHEVDRLHVDGEDPVELRLGHVEPAGAYPREVEVLARCRGKQHARELGHGRLPRERRAGRQAEQVAPHQHVHGVANVEGDGHSDLAVKRR